MINQQQRIGRTKGLAKIAGILIAGIATVTLAPKLVERDYVNYVDIATVATTTALISYQITKQKNSERIQSYQTS